MKQKTIPYLGAMYEIICRMLLVISAFNYFMISDNYYNNHVYIQNIFHSYWIMLFIMTICAFIPAQFIYKHVIPSHIEFIAKQNTINEINPMYTLQVETKEQLDYVTKMVEEWTKESQLEFLTQK